MFANKIPFRRYNFTVKDMPALLKMGSLRSGHIRQLEDSFKITFPGRYPLFTSSARSALYLYYVTHAGTGGENVITSPLAGSVAFAPALAAGIDVRFADVDPESYVLDPDSVMEKIDGKARFIQVIHLGGNPCDMKPFLDISKDHGINLAED